MAAEPDKQEPDKGLLSLMRLLDAGWDFLTDEALLAPDLFSWEIEEEE